MRVEHERPVLALVLGLFLALGACRPARPAPAPELPRPAGVSAAAPDLEAELPATAAGEEPAGEEALAESEEHHDDVPDDGEDAELAGDAQPTTAHPLDGWSEERLAAAVRNDLAALGPMSLGTANAGALINGVQAQPGPYYEPVSPSGAWATQETLDYLSRALAKVHEQFPGTAPLALGDISGKHGGPSRPHISHQSGRDVDIAYFYSDGARWYARATAKNLDLPRNWAFVRALVAETDVDLILIDRSIQALLERYALEQGEDPQWLSSIFRGNEAQRRPIIRHAPGHATHYHIRFFNPIAQETARRCHSHLLAEKLTQQPQSFVSHKVKKNETLGMIARKYGVTIPRLKAANGLRSSLIREKSVLRVPVAARGPTRTSERLRIPPRRVPPARTLSAAAD